MQNLYIEDDREHQAACLTKLGRKRRGAIFLPPGVGKTRIIIRNAAILFDAGAINAVFVIAPNEVHRQWTQEQLPLHLETRIYRNNLRAVSWDAKARTRKAAWELASKPIRNTLAFLSMNYEAIPTKEGIKVARKFLETYKVMFVLDESHRIQTPAAITTRRIQVLGPLAEVRRIMTGTPSTQTPFSLYSQFRFLDERILGFDSFLTFKHHYGIFTKEFVQARDKKGAIVTREYETLQEFQRLEELSQRIAPHSFRRTKEQCHDLPPKEYLTLPVALSQNQRKLYNAIKAETHTLLEQRNDSFARAIEFPEDADELLARVTSARDRISFKIKLTQSLRLQQVLGGHVTDDDKRVLSIDNVCPRMEAMIERIEQTEGKVIVWAQFRWELQTIERLLKEAGIGCAPYHGGVLLSVRQSGLHAFKKTDHTRVLVAHQQSAGTGLDLPMVDTEIYYTNGYSAVSREQSEDRAHRLGRKGTLMIVDMCAPEVPLDATIRAVHTRAFDLAEKVLHSTTAEFMEMI